MSRRNVVRAIGLLAFVALVVIAWFSDTGAITNAVKMFIMWELGSWSAKKLNEWAEAE